MNFLRKKTFIYFSNCVKKQFSSCNNKCVPNIFKENQKYKQLLRIYDQNELEILAKDVNKSNNSIFLKDIKEKKLDWVYETSPNYEKNLIIYNKFKYENILDFRSRLMKLGAQITRELTSKRIKEIDIIFPQKFNNDDISFLLNGLALTNYKFDLKSIVKEEKAEENGEESENNKKVFQPIENVNILKADFDVLDPYLQFKLKSAECTNFSRNLANTRANVANTQFMCDEASKLIKDASKTNFISFKGAELENLDLNLLYNVGKASKNPPMLVNLTYKGNPEKPQDIYCLIGKGIVFDAGGLSIKPSISMETMYMDKSGACTVLAVFKGLTELNLPINVTCTIALAENFVGSNSYRPSDVVKSHKGITVEIMNTDAEGRLCLADAMSWTQKTYNPHTLIELSTLTGACMVALGDQTAGLFSNNDALANSLIASSKKVSESLWRMPILEEHRESVKGEFADITNSPKSRYGGACTAAAFLEKFVEKNVKWVHLDIAGPADIHKEKDFLRNGATGFGTQTLMEYFWKIVQDQKKK